MTQAELAQALGISQAAVSKLARRGMPTDSVERASRWRRRHLQTGRMKGIRADTIGQDVKPATPPKPATTAPEDLDLFTEEDPYEDPDEARTRRFKESRERREHFAAEMARLNYERECGKLMLATEVVQVMADVGTVLRTTLEQLPDTIAPALVGKDERRIAAMLADEIGRALENLSAGFAKLARTTGEPQHDHA